MKVAMKHSAPRNSPEKLNRSTGKTPAKGFKSRRDKNKSQPSTCQQQPRRQRRTSLRSVVHKSVKNQEWAEISPVTQHYASLSTFNDRFVTFVPENGVYGIYVEDSGQVQEKDKVLLYRYASQIPEDKSVNGQKYMVKLRLKENENFWLHANKQKSAVEIKEFPEPQRPLPEQTFFLLHYKTSEYVSFECKSNPGTFIAVSGDHLELIRSKNNFETKTLFKLC